VHRAALAVRIAAAPASQLGHDAARCHPRHQHVAVVAVTGDDLVALPRRHLHADDDRFLADIEVAKAADEAHAVHLAGLFLEAANVEHLAIGGQLLGLPEGKGVERGLGLLGGPAARC
jgi:hypothetical protein